jgi:hypothetical protein
MLFKIFQEAYRSLATVIYRLELHIYIYMCTNLIDGVVVGVLASSAVGRGFDPRRVKSKTKIVFCCFSAKLASLRS